MFLKQVINERSHNLRHLQMLVFRPRLRGGNPKGAVAVVDRSNRFWQPRGYDGPLEPQSAFDFQLECRLGNSFRNRDIG